ncbi:uncharacterized protein LOC127264802 [Andrographis paniculata]|uniref:uncharacterized protein LOC127264802 n=1 Tax=Andrographis paniculata TaxID=175694 RepID=UPI0021E88DF7|nr:uncharacterized protein LOC127264802 [Andrographis paniculata]
MMRNQIMLREPSAASAVYRRQLLLEKSSPRRLTVAEFAGGTTAECAAVACCCPFGLANFLVLMAYKVPAGLCRKALRRKRHRRLLKQGLLQPRRLPFTCDETLFHVRPISSPLGEMDTREEEVIELEKEMWDRFYGAGFWRSPSQRSEISAQ